MQNMKTRATSNFFESYIHQHKYIREKENCSLPTCLLAIAYAAKNKTPEQIKICNDFIRLPFESQIEALLYAVPRTNKTPPTLSALQYFSLYCSDALCAILDALQEKGMNSIQLLKLFKIKTNDGWTVFMLLARYRPDYFLPVLNTLIDKDVSGVELLELFKIKNNDGWTAFMALARYHPEQCLTALNTLIDKDVSGAELLELFKIKDKDDWTAFMLLARYHPEQCLTALNTLIDKSVSGVELLALFKIKTNDGWTAFMALARYHPDKCLPALNTLRVQGVSDVKLLELFIKPENLLMPESAYICFDNAKKVFINTLNSRQNQTLNSSAFPASTPTPETPFTTTQKMHNNPYSMFNRPVVVPQETNPYQTERNNLGKHLLGNSQPPAKRRRRFNNYGEQSTSLQPANLQPNSMFNRQVVVSQETNPHQTHSFGQIGFFPPASHPPSKVNSTQGESIQSESSVGIADSYELPFPEEFPFFDSSSQSNTELEHYPSPFLPEIGENMFAYL